MGKVILFEGDSITDGNRYKDKSQEWDLNHQIGHSYVYIINALLGAEFPEKNYRFLNRGISGSRIVDLCDRMNAEIMDEKPDLISLLIGVNDAPSTGNNHQATPPEEFRGILTAMIEKTKQASPKARLIFCEPFLVLTERNREDFTQAREYVLEYQTILREISRLGGHIFVPLQEKFDSLCKIKNAEYWIWDGIHPTENGHGIIAKEWILCVKYII